MNAVREGLDQADRLDRLFAALGNRHRREMVQLLSLQPESISRLAGLRGLSLPAMNKHVRVLAEAGVVRRRKFGRTTFLALDRASLLSLQDWLGQYQAYWGTESETLANYEPYLTAERTKEGRP